MASCTCSLGALDISHALVQLLYMRQNFFRLRGDVPHQHALLKCFRVIALRDSLNSVGQLLLSRRVLPAHFDHAAESSSDEEQCDEPEQRKWSPTPERLDDQARLGLDQLVSDHSANA